MKIERTCHAQRQNSDDCQSNRRRLVRSVSLANGVVQKRCLRDSHTASRFTDEHLIRKNNENNNNNSIYFPELVIS